MAKGYTRSICSRFIAMTIPPLGREGGREQGFISRSLKISCVSSLLFSIYKSISSLLFSEYASFRYCKLDCKRARERQREEEEESLCPERRWFGR